MEQGVIPPRNMFEPGTPRHTTLQLGWWWVLRNCKAQHHSILGGNGFYKGQFLESNSCVCSRPGHWFIHIIIVFPIVNSHHKVELAEPKVKPEDDHLSQKPKILGTWLRHKNGLCCLTNRKLKEKKSPVSLVWYLIPPQPPQPQMLPLIGIAVSFSCGGRGDKWSHLNMQFGRTSMGWLHRCNFFFVLFFSLLF
jgi:hypothetical protein